MNNNLTKSKTDKLKYQSPQVYLFEVIMEYSVASGSNSSTSGDIQQVWDNEETQTQSKNDGWW